MFDVAPSELLLVIIVAIVVIGPKDLPMALRTAGRWIGKVRRVSNHFKSGIETMIREAEMEEMERKWREQNAAIMAQDVATQMPAAAADQQIAAHVPALAAPAATEGHGDHPAHEPATAPIREVPRP
jgi:sec-independent protein translocase protein TatB